MKNSIKYISFVFLWALLAACSGLQLSAGLGVRDTRHWNPDYDRSIYLGPAVGEVRLEQPIGDRFYTACTHVSGINDAEGDGGLNYCSGGFRVDF